MKMRLILQKLIPSEQISTHTKKHKHLKVYISSKKIRKSIKESSSHLSNNIKRFTRRLQRRQRQTKRERGKNKE